MTELVDTIARLSVFYWINGIWVGVLVVAVAVGLLRLFRSAPAALLHRMLWVAMITIVVTPILFSDFGTQMPLFGASTSISKIQVHGRASLDVVSEDLVPVNSADFSAVGNPSTWSFLWPAAVWGVWLVVSVLMVVRLVVGYRQTERLIRSARWGGARLQAQFARCKRRWVGGLGIGLRVSDEIASPAVMGIFRAVILIPASLVERLSDGELEQILKHEIGHIKRWDAWGNLLQRLLEAFLWCNPAIWWLSHQLSLTREMACDDYAIRFGHTSRDYAICLTRLTQMVGVVRGQNIGLGAMNRRPHLIRRVEYLLGDRGISEWLSRSSVWIAAAVFVLVGMVVVQVGPLWDVPGRAEAYLRIAQWSKPLARVLIGNPLPRGIGVSNKVVVVADEKNQKVLKPILEDLLLQPVLMPQPELIFEIVYVLPQDFDDYRAYRNLILALPRNGSPIWKAVAPPYLHKNADDMTVIRYDVWASDQVVVAIAAEDAVGISEQMALNEDRVVSAFDASMGQWLTSILYHAGENIERSSELEQRFGWRLRVPVGYELMDEYADQNFVAFVRQVDRRLLWLWVYWEDRIHPDQLTNDWCLLKRDDVARRFFGGDQTSPGEVNIYQKEFVGKLTVCLEGLWEHAKEWQGGPFKSYALVDVDQDRFFLINMGIYAPNRTKALQMRQLDALAHTFSLRPMYSMKD